jgi:hypothetical protein
MGALSKPFTVTSLNEALSHKSGAVELAACIGDEGAEKYDNGVLQSPPTVVILVKTTLLLFGTPTAGGNYCTVGGTAVIADLNDWLPNC